jgi:hypothetical protein
VLLALYALVPLTLAALAVDLALLGGALRVALPQSPETLLWFSVLFNYPHIVASSLIFADAQYIAHYRARLGVAVALAFGVAFALPHVIGAEAFALGFAAWTVAHVIGQQLGLTRMMTGVGGWRFHLWKWSGILGALALYLEFYGTGGGASLPPRLFVTIAWGLVPCFLVMTALVYHARAPSLVGAAYLWANFAMVAVMLVFFETGYTFFAVLIPRVVHDVTAFYFYGVHDTNRNLGVQPNALVRLGRRLRLPAYVWMPLLAVTLAWPVTFFEPSHAWVAALGNALALLHYYTERFAWRLGALPRRAVLIQ